MTPKCRIMIIRALSSLLGRLPCSVSFVLSPRVMAGSMIRHISLSRPLRLNKGCSVSIPFSLRFTRSVTLSLNRRISFLQGRDGGIALTGPRLVINVRGPVTRSLMFSLSVINGSRRNGPVDSTDLIFSRPFILTTKRHGTSNAVAPGTAH